MPARVVVTAVVTAAIVATTAGAGWAQHRYHDVDPDHPHYDAIERLSEAGIAQGDTDGYFHPEAPVTRGQTATRLATAAHLESPSDPPFDDVPAHHPHADGIAAAAETGLVDGYDDGTFRPQRSISRGQMATVLAHAYRMESDREPPFDDVDEDQAHAHGIAALAEHGVADGFDDGTYRPQEPVTRGQLAALLTRADPQL